MNKLFKEILGFEIQNKKLYEKAFIHKSAIDETHEESNERLEFIGDSVLGLVVANYLYEKYPHKNEGFLTRIRTKMVSGKALSKIASELNFHEFIKMNEKGLKNEWNKNPRLLEDALESVIGAIFVDKGFKEAKMFVETNIISTFKEELLLEDTNYKDILMRFSQAKQFTLPTYKLSNTNNKEFTIQVFINDRIIGEGVNKNKKQAEQHAAHRALRCFNLLKV